MQRTKMPFSILVWFLSCSLLHADSYQVFFPSTMPGMITDGSGGFRDDLSLVIVNTDSMNVTSVELDEYLDTYANSRYSLGTNFTTSVDGTSLNADKRLIQDFKGSSLLIRENGAIFANDKGADGLQGTADDGNNMYFDRILELNVETGKIISEKLIVTSQEGYDSATAAGFEVILAETGDTSSSTLINFKSYSENISNATATEDTVATKGNFSTNQITASDGASLFRQEEDGTVHIGENSIVLSDEAVSASGNDEVYSSSGTLQLGNDDTHATVIKGTLTVNTPTASGHAANKGYVDTQDAATLTSAKSYADTQDAATLTSAKSYADTQDAATLTSANSYADSIGAMAIASSQLYLNSSPNSALKLGVGLGSIGSQNAVALGVGGFSEELGMNYSLSVSYSNYSNKTAVGAGINWDLN